MSRTNILKELIARHCCGAVRFSDEINEEALQLLGPVGRLVLSSRRHGNIMILREGAVVTISTPTIHFRLNIGGLTGKYFHELQRLLEPILLLKRACAEVAEGRPEDLGTFLQFQIASSPAMPFEQRRAEAVQWLLKGFFREAVELTGLFLDDCLMACAYLKAAGARKATSAQLNDLLRVLPDKFHRLYLPAKIVRLSKEFNVRSQLESCVLGLNRLRACVVHRLGVVGPSDVDESGALKVVWRTTRVSARGETTGQVVVLDRPGIQLTEDSMIEFQFVKHDLVFGLGERVDLSPEEIHACLVTFFLFGNEMAQAVEGYARGLGLEVKPAAPPGFSAA